MTSNTRTVQATRRRINPTNPVSPEGYDISEACLYIIQNEAGAYRVVADLDDTQPVTDKTMVAGKWGEVSIVAVVVMQEGKVAEVNGEAPDANMPLRVMVAAPVETEGDQEVAQAA